MTCMCGDAQCPSCGVAQGTYIGPEAQACIDLTDEALTILKRARAICEEGLRDDSVGVEGKCNECNTQDECQLLAALRALGEDLNREPGEEN